MNLKETINLGVSDLLHTMRLCNIQLATINSVKPTTIKLSNDKILPLDFFIFSSRVKSFRETENIDFVGKKLVVIQQTGGQKYFVIDYVED